MKKIILSLLLSLSLSPAMAETSTLASLAPLETPARHAVVIEAKTGTVLFAKDADVQMPTSSMCKVLTMYLVFDAIKKGKLGLDTVVTVSQEAWKQPGSRTFLKIGQKVSVEDLVRGVIIQSGNDSSVALAEAVSGTEGSFVGLMNDKARELGLTNSHFMNVTGLPDPSHYSTARDLAVLSLALMRDFPEFYHYYSEKSFTFNGIQQGNRNPLLYRNSGVDGIKTGHTEDAGYGLIASAMRDGRRLLSVANGMTSMQARADVSAELLDWGYREYGLYELVKPDTKLADAKIWLGEVKTIPVAAAKVLELSLPRMKRDEVQIALQINPETEAPIVKGQGMGTIQIIAPGYAPIAIPLVAMEDVKHLGLVSTLIEKTKRLLGKE